jgi:Arc/MetJ-type ribon-helix-helix transcriptional regulator
VNTKRTHVVLPADLVSQIDTLVGKRKRSRFLADLASREVKRLRLLKALKRAAGSWKDEDHPELKNGAAAWVEQLRQEDEERFRRMTKP